ncbi:MAG: hypothetical protein ACYDBB_22810 [Armatimonadota bacterium]
MKRWSWLLAWTLLLLMGVGGGWWLLAQRREAGPLHLVTHRPVPLGSWLYLGAMSGEPAAEMRYTKSGVQIVWLDSVGNPNYGAFTVPMDSAFSPNGAAVVTRSKGKVFVYRRDGTVAAVTSPVARRRLSGVTDNGDFCDEGIYCSVALPDHVGRSMIAPAACNDTDYLPVLLLPRRGRAVAERGTAFALFNTTTHATRLTTPRPHATWPQAVFVSGARTACLDAKVLKVFDGSRLLATLPGAWRWCGDGTIWQATDTGAPSVMEWRQGNPRLVPASLPNVSHAENANAQALCDQGSLLARVEKAGAARELALYRHNTRIAAFRSPTPATTDHLAFSPDGRLLYWVTQTDSGAELRVLVVRGER